MTEKELLQLKESIEKAQKLLSELIGQKNYLLKDLQATWGCEPDGIDAKIQEFSDILDGLQAEQATLIDQIKGMQNDE